MKDRIYKILNSNYVYLLYSIIATIGVNMQIDAVTNTLAYNKKNIMHIILLIVIFLLHKKSNQNTTKRKKIFSAFLGVLFSVIMVLGNITLNTWLKSEVILSKSNVMIMMFMMLAYFIIFYPSIKLVFSCFEKIEIKKGCCNFFKASKINLFKIAAILFILWLPYLLNYYPGITSFDTNAQLLQGISLMPYSNHHPVFHTFIISCITKVGVAISESYNLGIALCAIIQMIACALTFSFVIIYMSKQNVNSKVLVGTFLFFGFCPFVPQLSIAIWKDIPFTLCMTLFSICLIEIIRDASSFFENKIKLLALFILSLLIMLFRNNGLYILALAVPFIIGFNKEYWKRIVAVCVIPIIMYLIFIGPGFKMLKVEKSESGEMLSIPVQQMARILKYKPEELSDEDVASMNEYISIVNAGEAYNPTISDPIKNEFKEEKFNNDKLHIVKLYLKLAVKYPGETMEALIGNTYGYYYPDVVTYAVATGNYVSPFEAEQVIDIHSAPIINIPIMDRVVKAMYKKEIPVLSFVSNIGLCFWLYAILVVYCWYKKMHRKLLVFIPVLVLFLTCIASPVSGELRYIYPMYTVMPLFITTTFFIDEEIKRKEEKK